MNDRKETEEKTRIKEQNLKESCQKLKEENEKCHEEFIENAKKLKISTYNLFYALDSRDSQENIEIQKSLYEKARNNFETSIRKKNVQWKKNIEFNHQYLTHIQKRKYYDEVSIKCNDFIDHGINT